MQCPATTLSARREAAYAFLTGLSSDSSPAPLGHVPGFLLLLPLQEVLMDGKRETTISQLLITPTDLDIGRVYVCRCSNDAIPAGKEASIKLNVH
ncbi:hypothetical protein E2320_014103, partial [Naja naja]